MATRDSETGIEKLRATGSNRRTSRLSGSGSPWRHDRPGSDTAQRSVPSRSGRRVKPHDRVTGCQTRCIPSRAQVTVPNRLSLRHV